LSGIPARWPLLSDDSLRRRLAPRTYLVEDCTSAVVVPGAVDYTDEAEAAFERYAAAGMHVVRSTDPIRTWPGMPEETGASGPNRGPALFGLRLRRWRSGREVALDRVEGLGAALRAGEDERALDRS
jgi:hypothetical protein